MSSVGDFVPGKLRSLWDRMERYAVGELIDLQTFFGSWLSWATLAAADPWFQKPDQMTLIMSKARRYRDLLAQLDLKVSAAAAEVVMRCMTSAPLNAKGESTFGGQNKDTLKGALETLANIVGKEMRTKLFLMLPANKATYYEQAEPLFGQEVAAAFPFAVEDISEAGMCFALGRYTSTIFHLMRALEVAVSKIADKIGATTRDAAGKGLPWGVIAQNMKIEVIDKMPKGSDDQINWYRVQSHLVAVNRAWRVPTAHPKQTYTHDESEAILVATRSFMQELAPLV